jgi:hypothetical protein
MGAIGTIVGGYILWSAKKLLANLENSIAEMKEEMTSRCKEHEERLTAHESCLIKIVTLHERNHDQHIGCDR